ncbi:MAG: hypothetical protein EBR02_00035 [Alphaproteobacteria bacterium]|nr:hypothetical protein [Alphaproteobacteria bacterium]
MPETNLNTQTTRDQLNGCFCQLAQNFGLLTEAQQARTLEVQARFVALGENTQGLTASALASDESWLKIADERNVSNEAMLAARTLVNYGNGVPKGVPAVGVIGFELGYTSKEDKNALLAAQAAERTLRATERTQSRKAEPINEEAFLAVMKAPKWQHMNAPSDPPYLKSAQAANFKAEMLEACVSLAPEMLQSGETNLAVQQALEALQGAATTSYMNAGNVLGIHHAPAAEKIKSAAQAIATEKHIDEPFDFVKTTARMRVADQGLVAAMHYIVSHQKLSPQTLQELNPAAHAQQQSRIGRF